MGLTGGIASGKSLPGRIQVGVLRGKPAPVKGRRPAADLHRLAIGLLGLVPLGLAVVHLQVVVHAVERGATTTRRARFHP